MSERRAVSISAPLPAGGGHFGLWIRVHEGSTLEEILRWTESHFENVMWTGGGVGMVGDALEPHHAALGRVVGNGGPPPPVYATADVPVLLTRSGRGLHFFLRTFPRVTGLAQPTRERAMKAAAGALAYTLEQDVAGDPDPAPGEVVHLQVNVGPSDA